MTENEIYKKIMLEQIEDARKQKAIDEAVALQLEQQIQQYQYKLNLLITDSVRQAGKDAAHDETIQRLEGKLAALDQPAVSESPASAPEPLVIEALEKSDLGPIALEEEVYPDPKRARK